MGITLYEAISLNTTAQQFDGTVHFVERHMAIFKELLGYECRSMALAEVEEREGITREVCGLCSEVQVRSKRS